MDIREQDCVYKTLVWLCRRTLTLTLTLKSNSNHVKLDPCASIQLKKCRFSMQGVKWNNESLLQTFHNVTCLLFHKTIHFFIKLLCSFNLCLTNRS